MVKVKLNEITNWEWAQPHPRKRRYVSPKVKARFVLGARRRTQMLEDNRGNAFMCRLIFLASINRGTLDNFLQKVRDETPFIPEVIKPSERALIRQRSNRREGTSKKFPKLMD